MVWAVGMSGSSITSLSADHSSSAFVQAWTSPPGSVRTMADPLLDFRMSSSMAALYQG